MDIVLSSLMQLAVVLSFCFVVYVAHQKASKLCLYLTVYSIAVFFDEFGYLMEIKSDTLSNALLAVKFEYLAGSGATIAALLFTLELFNIKIKLATKLIYTSTFFVSNCLVITNDYHHLHYISSSLEKRPDFSALHIECGPVYYFHTIITLTSMAFCIGVIIVGWLKDKKWRESFLKYILLIIAAFLPLLSWALRFSNPGRAYDLIPLGLFCTDIGFVLIIFFYHIFDVVEIGKSEIMDNMEEGVLVCDEQGKILYANKKIRTIFSGILLKHVSDVLLRLVPEQEGEFQYKNRFYSVTESEVYQSGKSKGKTVCFIDVTAVKEKEKQLLLLNEEAVAASNAKSNFLANMSHEIRTPINTILGMDEMILREGEERNVHEYAENIRLEGKTLVSLIDELLDFSKVESGAIQVKKQEYSLTKLLHELLPNFSLKCREKGIQFETNVSIDIPKGMLGDELRLRQILNNLLSNALKYTERGAIGLRTEWRLVDEKTAELILTVKDTGIGIREDSLPYVFEKFSRLDSKRNSHIEGSGLGLNITKQLVDLMTGTIQVKSEYGVGTEFTVTLPQPIVDASPSGEFTFKETEPKSPEKQKTFLAPDARILIVDDNVMNRVVVKDLLKRTGLQIDEAESGMECLKKTEEIPYQVILMDHMMAEMDGVETFQLLRKQNGYNQKTPVIILTANAVVGAKEFFMEAGFDDYLSKPVNGVLLEETLLHYLPSRMVKLKEVS